MKQIALTIIFFIVFWSCSDDDSSPDCNADNPLEMEWMKDIISELQNCSCTISVFQAEYEDEPVFWLLMNDPLCQSVIENVPVFNCRGDEILTLNHYAGWVTFNEKVSKRKIIYACSKNESQ